MTQDRQKLMAFYIQEIDGHMRENDFQRDFFESLRDWFESRGELTEPQEKSLKRIYERVTA